MAHEILSLSVGENTTSTLGFKKTKPDMSYTLRYPQEEQKSLVGLNRD